MRLFCVISVGKLCTLISGLLIVVSSGLPVASQRSASDPVRMAYTEFHPYSFTSSEGQAKGVAIDIARRLLERSGRDLEFVPASDPAAMMEMIVTGQADMTATLGRTLDRLKTARATLSFGSFQTVLLAKKNGAGRRLDDFHGSRLGVVTGALSAQYANEFPLATIVDYPNPDARIIGLLTGEIDAIVGAADSLMARLRQMGADVFVKVIDPPLGETPYGFFVSSSSGDLLATLNEEIEAQLTSAVLTEIREAWFGRPTRLPEHDYIFWGSIVGTIVLVVALGAIIRSQFYRRYTRSLLAENSENRLLIDALDGVDSAIVIFDRNMRAIHWNKGFTRTMPSMVKSLSKGAHLRSMISASYTNGTNRPQMNADEAEDFAENIIQRLATGETQNRIVHFADGRVFDATDFAVGDDHFASVRVDVTKLYKQADIIKTQKNQLETANERLSKFATIAAHDLKAPLVQQAVLMQFIKEDITDLGCELPDEILEHFNMLTNLSGKMKRLIQDLLDHSRVATTSDRFEDIDLNARLPDILDMVGLPSTFRVELVGEIPIVRVDPVCFDTMVRNLISNAVKHHNLGQGVIKIRGYEAEGTATIEFEDDGPGIPAEYRAAIFEPFKRLSSDVDGSGLGLSFINKTVLEWGGSIRVECPGKRGSVFVLSIPTVAMTRPLAQIEAEAEQWLLH